MSRSESSLPGESGELRRHLVAVYRPYVEGRLRVLGFSVPEGIDEGLSRGEAWLDDGLAAVLGVPFAEQTRSPLEVFQEAMRYPTEILEAAGIEPRPRDQGKTAALPGDLYDLAPASSQDLGEDVWRAHLAWGAAKARAMAPGVGRPLVVYLGANLLDSTRIEEAARRAGFETATWRGPTELEEGLAQGLPAAAFVDLAHSSGEDSISLLAVAGVRVVAFGPHVDDQALQRARGLGATEALARSRFFGHLDDLLSAID